MSSTSARPLLCVVSVLFSLRTRTLLSHASLRTRVCDRQAGWHDMDTLHTQLPSITDPASHGGLSGSDSPRP